MKRIVSVLTAFIIAAYCVALSLFVLSVIRAYSHAVPHISPQALVDATRIPLFIVLPATVVAVILAFASSKKSNGIAANSESFSVIGGQSPAGSEATSATVSDEEASPPEQDTPTSTSSEQSAPLSPTPDNAAIPQAVAMAAGAATGLDESPSPEPLEWHLPAPAASEYDDGDEGVEKVVTTYEITPDDEEQPVDMDEPSTMAVLGVANQGERDNEKQPAVIEGAKDEATSTDDGKASIPVIASEAKQPSEVEQSPMAEESAPVPEPPPEALSGSEALAQFSEAEAEESPLEAALSHKLVSAAADERDLSLVLIESDALGDAQSQEILDEAFSQHEIYEHGDNTYAIVKVGMTLDEALSAAEKVYNALPHDNGQCAIGISSRAIRLIGPATLLREGVAALERAKTEDTPIMAFRADTDKYRATLLSS